jgi:coenzyme PQQ precursor peptide PqqA
METFICCSCSESKDKQLKHHMNKPTDREKNSERVWETPTFNELPIAFEASSYALTDDDPPYR